MNKANEEEEDKDLFEFVVVWERRLREEDDLVGLGGLEVLIFVGVDEDDRGQGAGGIRALYIL